MILAIDTSCDETSVAVVDGRRIFANVIASQVELQKKYGGVYPIEAKRQHEKVIDAVVEEAMKRSETLIQKVKSKKQKSIIPKVSDALKKVSRTRSFVSSNEFMDETLDDKLSKTVNIDISTAQNDMISRSRISASLCPGRRSFVSQLDAVAVTVGPGLAPALEVGIRKAKELARQWNVPLIGVNHMEGHLLAPLAQNSKGDGKCESNVLSLENIRLTTNDDLSTLTDSSISPVISELIQENSIFPVLGLLVSGGHTEMVLMREIGKYELLGETLDDAAGECLDKVARMLGLGYPGGAVIEEFAKRGTRDAIKLPVPMKGKQGLDFSFSGLKTAALYEIRSKIRGGNRKMEKGGDEIIENVQWGRLENLDKQYIYDFCLAIQDTVIKALLYRLGQAIEIYKPQWVFLGGGVGANKELRKQLRNFLKKQNIKLGVPYSEKLYGDNAAMIGLVAEFKFIQNEFELIEQIERKPRLSWSF